jgi:hypothetical protein
MASDKIENSYKVAKWIEKPDSPASVKRYEETLSEMKRITEHEWIVNELKEKKNAKILDICGGWGIAGVALSKTIREKKIDTDLTILDIRRDQEKDSKDFTKRELGEVAKYLVADVTTLGSVNHFDVAVMWGYSTPHFDPWQMTKLIANISMNLGDNGVFLIEEMDRLFTVFVQSGYQRVLAERVTEDRAVLSLHSGYEPLKGSFSRLLFDLFEGKPALEEFYFWGLASLAQMLWMFFEDVDFLQRDRYRGVLIAKKPRRSLALESYTGFEPRLLR